MIPQIIISPSEIWIHAKKKSQSDFLSTEINLILPQIAQIQTALQKVSAGEV